MSVSEIRDPPHVASLMRATRVGATAETTGPPRALLQPKVQRGGLLMWTARVLLAAVLVVCAASSADARRRHHGYYGDGERASARTLDEWRARQSQGQNEQGQDRDQARGDDRGRDGAQSRAENPDRWRDRYRDRYDRRRARYDEWRRAREDRLRSRDRDEELSRSRAAERGDVPRGRSGPFGATIEKLVRGCVVQAAEFENWPFDAISRTVGADETQRKALDGLRDAAKQAAQRLSTDCPQDVPAAPAARLEAAEQGIAAALKSFDIVEPKLAAFYAALNDEQKARLYRDMATPAAANAAQTAGARAARDERRERYSSRRHRWRDYAAARERIGSPHEPEARLRASSTRYGEMRDSRISLRSSGLRIGTTAAAPGWSGMCEELGSVLRNWPVREIERDVRLAGAQRVALYELVTTSLKAAETLSSACPAEAALTPVGRMESMRKRLAAVRAATAAIRPALARFYEALDQGQKVRFAGMS
jgi:LTXXQ motif family protein